MKKTDYPSEKSSIPKEEVSPELLAEIRRKVIKQRKRSNLKFAVALCLLLPVLGYFGYAVLYNFSFGFESIQNYGAEPPSSEMSPEKKNEKYLFFLTDGDKWLQNHRYHNAIFQYKKAVEMIPSEYDAQYRLALAYSYQCQYKFEGCEAGMKLVQKLERQLTESKFDLSEILKMEKDLLQVKAVFEHWGVWQLESD